MRGVEPVKHQSLDTQAVVETASVFLIRISHIPLMNLLLQYPEKEPTLLTTLSATKLSKIRTALLKKATKLPQIRPTFLMKTTKLISDGASNGTSNTEIKGGSKGREKVSYQNLCNIIIEICEDWKTTQEIAQTINYNHKYLGSKIIPRMIADRLLEPYDKQSPKSPEQKYRAIHKNK